VGNVALNETKVLTVTAAVDAGQGGNTITMTATVTTSTEIDENAANDIEKVETM
jgi:hypothetical protein